MPVCAKMPAIMLQTRWRKRRKKVLEKLTFAVFLTLFSEGQSSPPLALHQLLEIESGGEAVLRLHGHDQEGDSVSQIEFILGLKSVI